eukprot:148654-Prorocentrum_minimum.AAC.1
MVRPRPGGGPVAAGLGAGGPRGATRRRSRGIAASWTIDAGGGAGADRPAVRHLARPSGGGGGAAHPGFAAAAAAAGPNGGCDRRNYWGPQGHRGPQGSIRRHERRQPGDATERAPGHTPQTCPKLEGSTPLRTDATYITLRPTGGSGVPTVLRPLSYNPNTN